MADCPKASRRRSPSKQQEDTFSRDLGLRNDTMRWILHTHAEIAEVVNAVHQGVFDSALNDRLKEFRQELENALQGLEEALFLIPDVRVPWFLRAEARDHA